MARCMRLLGVDHPVDVEGVLLDLGHLALAVVGDAEGRAVGQALPLQRRAVEGLDQAPLPVDGLELRRAGLGRLEGDGEVGNAAVPPAAKLNP